MRHPSLLKFSFCVISTLLLQACTQSPAAVVNRGSDSYKRGGTTARAAGADNYSPYSSGMTVPGDSQRESAEVPAVTVGELQPITAAELPAPVEAAPVDPAPDTIQPPLSVDHGTPVISPDVTGYETNPSQTLGTVKAGTTNVPPAEQPVPIHTGSAQFIWPVKGNIITPYGKGADGEFNDGINIAATQGEPIVASADGEVVYSGNELRGYGNMVILKHDGNIMTAYAHADRILVDKGDKVKQGVAIATVGQSGGVSQPQVHFGVRLNKEPVDPIGYLTN